MIPSPAASATSGGAGEQAGGTGLLCNNRSKNRVGRAIPKFRHSPLFDKFIQNQS